MPCSSPWRRGRVVAVTQWVMGNRSRLRRSMRVDLPTPDGPDRTNTSPVAGGSGSWSAACTTHFGRTYVLLSAHPELGRVQRTPSLPRRGIEAETPFSLLVRKHLRNARLRAVRQPRLERVFELDCEQRDSSGRLYRVVLIVEAMGRRSNLVLVAEDGAILDAARRAPPSRNPRRPVLPHLRYEPPPAQDRLLPAEISAESLAAGARGQTLARYLSDRVAGLSPLAGRELAFRAVGDAQATLEAADWGV